MRNELVELLRQLEQEGGYKNRYTDFSEEYMCSYSIEECLDFPDYRFVVEQFNKRHLVSEYNAKIITFSSSSIKAELKRMEVDRLIIIGVQDGIRYGIAEGITGPDFDGVKFTSESIILTTKGKSGWRYFIYKATENPVNTVLSSLAIVISIISLFR